MMLFWRVWLARMGITGPLLRSGLSTRESFGCASRAVESALLQLKPFGALRAALKHHDWRVRVRAADLLGQLKDPEAAQPLRAALNDPDHWVRGTAVWALANIGEPSAVESVIGALKHSDSSTRCAAAHALGKTGNVRAVEALMSLLEDTTPSVREEAVTALGAICDPRAVDVLVARLFDHEGSVAEAAARSLRQIMAVHPSDKVEAALRRRDEQQDAAKEEAKRKALTTTGSRACQRCAAGMQWWHKHMFVALLDEARESGTTIIASSATADAIPGLKAGDMPDDFVGVCARCKDGFCRQHAPSRVCPKCEGRLEI